MSGTEEEGWNDSPYHCVVANKSPKESHSMDYWDELPPALAPTISPTIIPAPSKASEKFQSSLDFAFEEFALPPPIAVSLPMTLEEPSTQQQYPFSEFDDDFEGSHFDDDLPIVPFDHSDMLFEETMDNISDYSQIEEDDQDDDDDDEIQLMMEHDHYYVDDSIPMLSNLSHHHAQMQNFVM